MKIGELFAGIGGFGLAAERVWGAGCVSWAVENEPFATEWYNCLFPGVRMYGDVRAVQGSELEPVDLICGGFPCQDLSTANPKGKGLDGEKSGLWTEFARLVRECRPRWVVVENVGRLLTFGKGGSYRVVTGDLRDAGYAVCRPVLMSAAALGAPHGRTRLWIVAHRAQSTRPMGREMLLRRHSEGVVDAGNDEHYGSESDAAGRARRAAASGRSGFGFWDDWLPVRGADGTVRLVPAEAVADAGRSGISQPQASGRERAGTHVDRRDKELGDTARHLRRTSRDAGRITSDGTGADDGRQGFPQPSLHASPDGLPARVVLRRSDDPTGEAQAPEREGQAKGVMAVNSRDAVDEGRSERGDSERAGTGRDDSLPVHGTTWQSIAGGDTLPPPPRWRGDAEGFPPWPVAIGVPNRTGTLRGAGNAIIPQAAEVIFRAIAATDDFPT